MPVFQRDFDISWQSLFLAMFEESVVPCWLIGGHGGRIVAVNKAFLRLSGYSEADLQDKEAEAVLLPAPEREAIDKISTSRRVRSPFDLLVRKDGSILRVRWNMRHVGTEEGLPLWLLRLETEGVRDVAHPGDVDDAHLLRRLGVISSVTSAILGRASIRDLGRALAEQVREAFKADACVIRLMEGDDLVLLAASGVDTDRLVHRGPWDQGIGGDLIRGRKPMKIDDVRTRPLSPAPKGWTKGAFEFLSYAGAPMLIEGRPIGIIGIYSSETPFCFSDEDTRHLQDVANHVAVAVWNDMLFEEVEEKRILLEGEIAERRRAQQGLLLQLDRLQLLNEVTRFISERRELTGFFRLMLEGMLSRMPADVCCFLSNQRETLDQSSSRRLCVMAPDFETDGEIPSILENSRLPLDRPVLVEDVAEEEYLEREIARTGLRTVALCPVASGDEQFGALVVGHREPQRYGDKDFAWLQQLAGHVGVALAQALLLENLERAYLELKATQDAAIRQERLSAMGRLASGIVHDISNSLSPILCYPDLILEEESLAQESRDNLETIKLAAGDINAIVDRLRDFYRRDSQEEQVGAVDLAAVCRQALELTRPRWRSVALRDEQCLLIETDLADGLPAVRGNEVAIREAVINLLLNALDAMPDGGVLTLRVEAPGDHVVLEVGDSGMGMDAATRDRCLEPFYTTKGDQGTGMGLAMVYGMMERLGGKISIDSAPGKGTRVSLKFKPLEAGRAK